RTFTYVKDVTKAFMALMQHEGAIGDVFNVGGVQEISMLDLAGKIIEKSSSASEISLISY
ncbi:MAG: nucleoside-diphosphate sugar epimerase, partial [Deltaproteobacteria bacterium]|nr:nucleoside-diphosphate sugar epimerase [Deltaproteobacteria bacterium]